MWHTTLATRLLRRMDPETAHHWALWGLSRGLAGSLTLESATELRVTAFGLCFANPFGLAAGFDKNAIAAAPLARLGFGFVETGTVTPRPQPGNPRPRLFRLSEDQAIINRMGFNNDGLAAYAKRLASLSNRTAPVGANIGINKEGANPERDYAEMAATLAHLVDYIVVNVSSPNTPGLRDLQSESRLGTILTALRDCGVILPPVLVKLAPDLAAETLEPVIETCVEAGVAGLILTNTTLSRPPGLHSPHAAEAGGLSGAPLFELSTAMLARAHLLAKNRLTLIGVGGIRTGQQALRKIEAGATLLQVYSAFVYEGAALLPRLRAELLAAMRAAGYGTLAEATGADAARIAQGS